MGGRSAAEVVGPVALASRRIAPKTWLRPRLPAWVAVALGIACGAARAQGGPPMLTDDPDTPGDGRWEINTAYTDFQAHDARVRSLPHVDVNFGLGDRIQLKYETGVVFSHTQSAGTQSGLDDALLGVKWRFVEQSEFGANLSTYPQYQIVDSRSAVDRRLATSGPNFFLPLELSKEYGRGTLVAELGYQFMHERQSFWVWGVLGAFPVKEGVELLAEYRRFVARLDGSGDGIVNVGFRARLTEHVTAIGAIGRSVQSLPDSPTWIAYLGARIEFGKEKH